MFQYLTTPLSSGTLSCVSTQLCPQMHAITKTFVCNKSIYRGCAPDFFFNGKFETVGGDKTSFLLDLFFLSHNGGEKEGTDKNEARSQRPSR